MRRRLSVRRGGALRRGGKKVVAMKSQYIGSCVNNPFDDLETLENVIDGATEISRKVFLSSCDVSEDLIQSMLEFPFDYDYCQSKHDGGTVYFFTHSAIEHFFA